jgi:hypothetical protein
MLIGFAGIGFADFESRWARHRVREVSMKTKLLALVVGMAMFVPLPAMATTTYEYIGPLYTNFANWYDCGTNCGNSPVTVAPRNHLGRG